MKNSNQTRIGNQPLHELLQAATEPARNYSKKVKRKQFSPLYARFKLKFYYKDGNCSVHYSYDFYNHTENGEVKKITDENVGWIKLLRCIEKNQGLFISAVIWCKLGDNTEVAAGGYNNECAKFKANGSVSINQSIRFRAGRMDWQNFIKNDLIRGIK